MEKSELSSEYEEHLNGWQVDHLPQWCAEGQLNAPRSCSLEGHALLVSLVIPPPHSYSQGGFQENKIWPFHSSPLNLAVVPVNLRIKSHTFQWISRALHCLAFALLQDWLTVRASSAGLVRALQGSRTNRISNLYHLFSRSFMSVFVPLSVPLSMYWEI